MTEATSQAGSQASGQSSLPLEGQSTPGAAAASATTPSQTTPNSSPSSAVPAARPAYVPESHWDASAGKVKDEAAFATFINEHVAFKASEDSRRLTIPKPDEYKVELPADFKTPEGVTFTPNDKDPLLPQARAFANKHGLSQDAFKELVAFKAAIDIAGQQELDNFRASEIGKLGATGTQRKTAVDTWLKATLGDGLGTHIGALMQTADSVAAFEKLMGIVRTQGGGSYSHAHREPDAGPRVTDEQYDKMSFAEKRAYAEKHQQPASNGAGR